MVEDLNNKKNEINLLNEKIEQINNTNKQLTNKLDEINFNNKNLKEEKNNLEIKIKKIEEEKDEIKKKLKNGEKSLDKKIIVTNSDYQPEDEFSEIIYNLNDEQSNNEDKNLIEINKKLQEKINQLQLELNNQILNQKDNKINNRKVINNNYIIENKSIKSNNDNEINELKISFNKELKMKEDMIEQLQQKINDITNNNPINQNKNKFYNHKDYTILCDKNFKNLKFFLLTPKIKEKNKKSISEKNKINKIEQKYTYENVFWVDQDHIEKDIDKYNTFENEKEEENKIIMNYIKKLEEKENIISKLTLKITNIEKSFNNKNSSINNEKVSSKNRSKSSNSKPYTDKILFEKEDEKSEEYKESDKIDEYNKKSTYSSVDIEKKYYNIEEELRANKNQIQIYKKIFKDLESKMAALKESCKNLFSKMTLSKLEKEEVKQILKLFEFSDNEINLIIYRKRK